MKQHEHASFENLLQRLGRELRVLPDKPDETVEATLTCLWALACGKPLAISQAAGFSPQALDARAERRLLDLVEQRLSGEPLAHLTGRQDFMGAVLLATPAALVPRRETEQLGYAAVARLREVAADRPLMIDVCTGAGNVALGVASHVPQARVLGADLSEEAVSLARDNARFLGREDVEFLCGDLLAPFAGRALEHSVDVLTCNPPYISTSRVEAMPEEISRHEPKLAFDGGPFGVKIIRRIINEAPQFLKTGAWLLLEVGAGQGAGVARQIRGDTRYDVINTHADAGGEIRVVEARCISNSGA